MVLRKSAAALMAVAALLSGQAVAQQEVNIYSSRQEALIKPLLDRFTAETGVKVNLVSGKDDALISRLEAEGKRSPADILITADAGRLFRAKDKALLQPYASEVVDAAVPASLRDKEGYWSGVTFRARPIFYVKGKVDPSELSTYEQLAEAEWKGRICIRSSSNIYNQSLIASMIATQGEAETAGFVEGLVNNFAKPPAGGDTDQLRAAAAGQCDIAIANTYYFGRLATSDKAADQQVADKLGIIWPNQNDRGTHINVSGIAITQSARNVEAARQLIEFMLQPDAQQWYAEVNNEYPVVEGVASSEVITSWGEFKADSLNLTELGENNRKALQIMDRAGWR